MIHSATYCGARQPFEPRGERIQFGVTRKGVLATQSSFPRPPLQNPKGLYGTGAVHANDETGMTQRVVGVKGVIKDGIVYDAAMLRAMMAAQNRERAVAGDRDENP